MSNSRAAGEKENPITSAIEPWLAPLLVDDVLVIAYCTHPIQTRGYALQEKGEFIFAF